jgi:hypothetical protein
MRSTLALHICYEETILADQNHIAES